MSKRHWYRRALIAAVVSITMVWTLVPATADVQDDDFGVFEEHSMVTLSVPDQARLDALVEAGFDLDHDLERVGNGYTITAIITDAEAEAIEALGVGVDVEFSAEELEEAHEAHLEVMEAAIAEEEAIMAAFDIPEPPVVVIGRADYYSNPNGSTTLSVEAKNIAGAGGGTMTVRYFDAGGNQLGQFNLSNFTDAGQYMYHRGTANVTVRPAYVTVTSANGGLDQRDVVDWLGPIGPGPAHRYFTGFLERYYDADGYYELIENLAAQYPNLAEIVELPYETIGYDRPAMALFGGTGGSAVGITSNTMSSEGAEAISVHLRNPGAANAPLTVSVTGNAIVVDLATNAESGLTSTAAQVVAAINASPAASTLVHAYTYRNNAGAGVVAAAGPTQLEDYLTAPASVERGPRTMKLIRIGKHRDGSRTGVFGYSAEHAREWQTPLVAVETASRLLHNYATDADTRKLVDNLDIFILPVTNPGGELYSKYDFASKRRNMSNHCARTGQYDLNARNSWGVDINRNYTAYSGHDGYSGGSTSCTSDTYSGPSELSEPEAANMAWIGNTFTNIKFSMNIHSSGNYYMWSPGSYATPGRISAPRPTFGEENFFYYMADRILTQIKQQRGLTVTPARTGPIADVLYSAAGNSGDMFWYDYDVFAFSFETGTSFQPSFASGAGSEAWQQMMEFSNGLVELIHVALDWTRDRYAPTTWIEQETASTGAVGVTFGFSEPVEIYYTTDGSNPTTSSASYQFANIREDGEILWFTETATLKWFSVDLAGNVEGKYNPARNNARTATITVG